MEKDMAIKKSLTIKRIVLWGVAMVLAAAAFALLTILSTNLARAQDGSNTPAPPHTIAISSGDMLPFPVLDQAVADGIITQEQADQVRAKMDEIGFTISGAEAVVGAFPEPLEFISPLDHLDVLLQEAVADGRITQAEAEQIQADFDAGTLHFLAITDEGVYTDPDDVPEGAGVMVNGQITTVEGNSFAFVIQDDGTLPNMVPAPVPPVMTHVLGAPFVTGLNDALSQSVSEGIITQEQMDEILALAETMAPEVVFSTAAFGTPQLPNEWLLTLVDKALQDAAANGKITSEQADSLLQQLTDALSE